MLLLTTRDLICQTITVLPVVLLNYGFSYEYVPYSGKLLDRLDCILITTREIARSSKKFLLIYAPSTETGSRPDVSVGLWVVRDPASAILSFQFKKLLTEVEISSL